MVIGNLMGSRIRVLSVGISPPFVAKDVELLREHYEVTHLEVTYTSGLRSRVEDAFSLTRMVASIPTFDVVYFWTANLHSYVGVRVAERFGVPTVVAIGGFEVARVPEFDYGGLLEPSDARRIKYVLENADAVLAVDEGLVRDAEENLGVSGDHIETVPTGYDIERYTPKTNTDQLVLAVAAESKWNRARLKGLDTFVTTAADFDDTQFAVIGVSGDALRRLDEIAPPNVELVEPMPHDDLIPWYERAKVYCQLSYREGLPNSLCEAMLSGCVPVGTDTQGIRTAIGNTGFLVPFGDVDATREAIDKALESPERARQARERIATLFPLERREQELVRIIDECVYPKRVDGRKTEIRR